VNGYGLNDKTWLLLFTAVRKLTLKKGKVEGKLERRSLVADYSSFGSQAFAPLTRIGVFVDRLADQYVVKNRYLMTYDGK